MGTEDQVGRVQEDQNMQDATYTEDQNMQDATYIVVPVHDAFVLQSKL